MRYSTPFTIALSIASSIGLLTACSGGGTTLPNTAQILGTSTKAMSPHVNATLVYVCGGSQCIWYPVGSNTPAGMLTGLNGPGGIGVDKNGNVYISESGAGDVLVYRKGSTKVLKTLADPGQNPNDVAIGTDGTVYVSNNTPAGIGSVSVYAHGSLTPTSTITDPNFGFVVSLALDKNGSLYVCYAAGPNGKCDEFLQAKGHGITVIEFGGIVLGLATDAAGNVVVNNGLGSTLVYSEPTSPYSPAKPRSCNSFPEAAFPDGLALDNVHGDFYVVHYFENDVTQEAYPGCTGSATLEFTYSTGWSSTIPQNVAVDGGA